MKLCFRAQEIKEDYEKAITVYFPNAKTTACMQATNHSYKVAMVRKIEAHMKRCRLCSK